MPTSALPKFSSSKLLSAWRASGRSEESFFAVEKHALNDTDETQLRTAGVQTAKIREFLERAKGLMGRGAFEEVLGDYRDRLLSQHNQGSRYTGRKIKNPTGNLVNLLLWHLKQPANGKSSTHATPLAQQPETVKRSKSSVNPPQETTGELPLALEKLPTAAPFTAKPTTTKDQTPSPGHERRDRLLRRISSPLPPPQEQLMFWDNFVDGMPDEFTAVLEFFDAIPKFFAGSYTSLREGEPLPIQKRPFSWNGQEFSIEIKPVIRSFEGPDGKTMRKEILAAEREDIVLRVLRKMACEKKTTRVARATGVSIEFTLYELGRRLAEIGHGLSIRELREALETLHLSPLEVRNETLKRRVFTGSYINLEYGTSDADTEGRMSKTRVSFNSLATAAIIYGIYDRIHFPRLMKLKTSLERWLYETVVRLFRNASEFTFFTIQLSRIERESPMRPYSQRRSAIKKIDEAFAGLANAEIIRSFPPVKKEISYMPSAGGRPSISEVTWTFQLGNDIIAEIRQDNAERAKREADALENNPKP